MTTPQLQDLLQKSTAYLSERGIENARRESEWIFSHFLELSRMDLYTRYDMPIEDTEVTRLREAVTRRSKREPLAYVLGTQPFRQLELQVSPAVLVPRPETEELIDLVLQDAPATARCLDIGTGSGAIALSLAHERQDWEVQACDVSKDALAVAEANGARLDLGVEFFMSNLLQNASGTYDLIIANLPYIADHERHVCSPEVAFEPEVALFAEDDGLALIKQLIIHVDQHLAEGGLLWLEHGWQQGEAICLLAREAGFDCDVLKDLSDKGRFARIQRRA